VSRWVSRWVSRFLDTILFSDDFEYHDGTEPLTDVRA
jgi:hypothetical protein